jgi:FixJ family two-component response regulator
MNTPATRQVFLVDDDDAVRDALQMLLTVSGLQVRGFASAESFLEYYRPEYPGCLILDIRMPGMSGLKLQEELLERRINLPIIFITAHGDIPTAVDAVKRGAVEFIEKPFDDYRLMCLVLDALELDAQTRLNASADLSLENRLASLTRRERQVLERVLAGKTSRAISEELYISVRTVEFHRRKVMHKLHADSLRELFHMCLGNRILEPALRARPSEPRTS